MPRDGKPGRTLEKQKRRIIEKLHPSQSVLLFKDSMHAILNGRGSGGNVVAALASLFVPEGRVTSALVLFTLSGILWILSFGLLGWVGHLLACLDAALWKGPR